MALLGAHMSIAGGYFKAVERAAEEGCDVVQIFTKNNNQWRAKPISSAEAEAFQSQLGERKIAHPLSHASYLINLASPDEDLRQKSIKAFVVELERADQLGIPFVVLHPGSFTTSDEETGIENVVSSLNEIHQLTDDLSARCLLENTAGQGSNLGWSFEQLAAMFEGVEDPDRLGVCLDTCHAFAAGYPLADRKEYLATFREFDKLIGVDRIKAFHLNDSKRELGSRVDRHEHIGQGEIGIKAFEHLLNDRRFRRVPMYLETPKGDDEQTGHSWDTVNLKTLRHLIK